MHWVTQPYVILSLILYLVITAAIIRITVYGLGLPPFREFAQNTPLVIVPETVQAGAPWTKGERRSSIQGG